MFDFVLLISTGIGAMRTCLFTESVTIKISYKIYIFNLLISTLAIFYTENVNKRNSRHMGAGLVRRLKRERLPLFH